MRSIVYGLDNWIYFRGLRAIATRQAIIRLNAVDIDNEDGSVEYSRGS